MATAKTRKKSSSALPRCAEHDLPRGRPGDGALEPAWSCLQCAPPTCPKHGAPMNRRQGTSPRPRWECGFCTMEAVPAREVVRIERADAEAAARLASMFAHAADELRRADLAPVDRSFWRRRVAGALSAVEQGRLPTRDEMRATVIAAVARAARCVPRFDMAPDASAEERHHGAGMDGRLAPIVAQAAADALNELRVQIPTGEADRIELDAMARAVLAWSEFRAGNRGVSKFARIAEMLKPTPLRSTQARILEIETKRRRDARANSGGSSR